MQGKLVAILLAGVIQAPLYGGETARVSTDSVSLPPAGLSFYLAGLDSPEYAARRSASAGLHKLLESADGQTVSKIQHAQVPWQTLSFEVRRKLTAMGLWPTVHERESRPSAVDSPKIASLVKSLSSDRYLDRAHALEQIRAAVRQRPAISSVYPALKRVVADPALTIDVRLTLDALLETARYTWLTDDESIPKSPPSAEQISDWIRVVASGRNRDPGSGTQQSPSQTTKATLNAAERELLDALAQDAAAADVKMAVEAALSLEGLDGDALARLRRLEEWARPGIAAEYWQRRRNVTVQFYVVGVASQASGARLPERFDHVGPQFAFGVGGNGLRAGEYPLDVAFPHPREQAAFLRLAPLATARERLIYQYGIAAFDDAERLRVITERTLGPPLARQQPLGNDALWLLGQLDQATVARLLRAYFAEVPDEPFDLSQLAPMLTDVSSVHRAACLMLALDGSHEVVPALVEAAETKRPMSLAVDEPQALPWVAALAIAARDPWEGVDDWLGGLVECTDRISFGQEVYAEVGATAAAMLLARNGQQPAFFGLVARMSKERGLHDRFEAPINADYRRRMFEDRMFKQLGLTPHSFATEDDRQAVLIWWGQQQTIRLVDSTSPAHGRP